MKTIPLALIITLFSLSPAFGDELASAKKAYAKKDHKTTQRIIKKTIIKDPKDLDMRRFGVDYSFREGKTRTGKSLAQNGYLLAPPGSEYQYYFYNKMINNKLHGELSFTEGSKYDKTNYYLEYQHNYSKRNWFILSYLYEERKAPFNQFGDQLGLGFITFFDKDLMLYTNFQLGLRKSFFPNLSIDNEIFKFHGNNTYSLDLRLSFYETSSVVFLSPHYRRDFDKTYLGARPTIVLSEGAMFLYWRVYGGYIFNYKHKVEAGVNFGSTKDDGLYIRDFVAYDVQYKYNLTHKSEMGLRYNYLNNYGDRVENTYSINFLWKY